MYVVHAGERQCSSSALHAVHAVLGLAGQTQGTQLALHMLQGPVAAALADLADQAALLLHRQVSAVQDLSGCLVPAPRGYLPPHSAGAYGCLSSRLPLHQPAEQQHLEPYSERAQNVTALVCTIFAHLVVFLAHLNAQIMQLHDMNLTHAR